MAKNKRPQSPKPKAHDPLNARTRAVVDRAGSNAAGPHPTGREYKRNPKHKNRQEW